MILKTYNDVLKFLNETFDDNLKYHEAIKREFFRFQTNNTGVYTNETIHLGYNMVGLIGTNVKVVEASPNKVVLTTEDLFQRRKFTTTNIITKMVNTHGENVYDYVKFDNSFNQNEINFDYNDKCVNVCYVSSGDYSNLNIWNRLDISQYIIVPMKVY